MLVVDLLVKLYLVIVVLDVLLAWVQDDPRRSPRRWTHALTEPPQRLLRRLLPARLTGGWDLSALMVIALLGVLRVLWAHPW